MRMRRLLRLTFLLALSLEGLLIAVPASAAWSHTNSHTLGATNASPSETSTLSFTPAADRLLVVSIYISDGTDGVSSVIGAGVKGTGNNFSLAVEQKTTSTYSTCSMWYGVVGASPSTSLQVTLSANSTVRVIVDEWSGNNTDQTAVLENTNSGLRTTNGSSLSTGSVSVTSGNLLMSALTLDQTSPTTISAGTSPAFTALESVNNKDNSAYRIAAETSDSNTWTWTGTTNRGAAVIAGFKTPVAPTCTPTMTLMGVGRCG